MKKLVCLVPGIGYNTDKPLLYYSGKIALQKGYNVIRLKFDGFPVKKPGDTGMIRKSFDIAYEQMKKQLADIRPEDYDKIIFISKSIGTAVAANYQKENGIIAGNIYLTPLAETFDYMRKDSGIAFHGTSDPWAEDQTIESGCREKSISLYVTQNANHSLETEDVLQNIKNLEDIMNRIFEYI